MLTNINLFENQPPFIKKLDIKIKELLLSIDMEINDKNLIKSNELNEKIKEYVIRKNIDINSIPTGKGKCLTKEQKNYKLAYQYLIKLLDILKQIKMQQQWY